MANTMKLRSCFLCLIAVTLLSGCQRDTSDNSEQKLAATNTYLECAAGEFLKSRSGILRLAGPGMCPGHFDIRPAQVQLLSKCKILFRFEFQKALDDKLTGFSDSKLQIKPIKFDGGLCEPESYLQACRQIGAFLVETDIISEAEKQTKLLAIEKRMTDLANWSKNRMLQANLYNSPIIASQRQSDFCNWLGFKVIAEMSAGGIRAIDQIISEGEASGVSLVIGNEPEGRNMADAIAERLGAKVVMLKNFPGEGKQDSFESMVRYNVDLLVCKEDK